MKKYLLKISAALLSVVIFAGCATGAHAAGPAGIVEKLFLQKGAGSVARTFADTLGDHVNVKNFGAKLDGITDDTAAVQKAINSFGVSDAFSGSSVGGVVDFVPGKTALILGTIYLPSYVKIDLRGAMLRGSGTNTIIKTGYWSGGIVIDNTALPVDTQFVVAASVENGSISNADRAFDLLNFGEGSALRKLRFIGVNQVLHARRSFYSAYSDLHARSPIVGSKYPAFHFDDQVNAQRIDSLFSVAYNTGFRFSGVKDNILATNCGVERGLVGVDVHDSTAAAQFLGWYMEDLTTAFAFNADGKHQNIKVDGTWFYSVTNAISGGNVISGEWGANNVLSGAAINLPGNFVNRMKVAIPSDTTADNAIATIPTGYNLGDGMTIDYVKSIYNSGTGLIASKARVSSGVIPFDYAGDSGAVISNQIPFSTSILTATTLTVNTKINYRESAFVGLQLTIQASGTQQVAAIYCGGVALSLAKPAGVTVAVSNNNGFFTFTVTGLKAATTYNGVVRIL
ncbi:glycosyl hydrolase family 28-related protein [Massilia sp. S19_KUP03_FR1]|uniref:glycosyl hydrolase family 28-related protein n=1 Tax=Massilia sp. S19_KUP03_FR1 TaxID=3025503 RepID=UPI002FCDBA26